MGVLFCSFVLYVAFSLFFLFVYMLCEQIHEKCSICVLPLFFSNGKLIPLCILGERIAGSTSVVVQLISVFTDTKSELAKTLFTFFTVASSNKLNWAEGARAVECVQRS